MSKVFALKSVALVAAFTVASGCATQRYGRATPVSPAERALLNCETIALEIARNDAFLEDVRRQRSSVSGAHVLGALGDFGIGNVMEGNAAEASGVERRAQLEALRAERGCTAI